MSPRVCFFFMEIEKSLILSILYISNFLLLQLISCSSMAQSARMGSIGLHHVNIVPQSTLESPGVTTTLACMMDSRWICIIIHSTIKTAARSKSKAISALTIDWTHNGKRSESRILNSEPDARWKFSWLRKKRWATVSTVFYKGQQQIVRGLILPIRWKCFISI